MSQRAILCLLYAIIMATNLTQQIKQELNQYRLEVQNQELKTQIAQTNRIIELQNQHIEQIFNSMNLFIGIMGLYIAIFGVIMPIWNAWKSAQMKKEVELAVKDANSFITNKFYEWEKAEAEKAIERYLNDEISWQSLHSILKYKPLNFEQMSKIYNTAIHKDNQNMLECLTYYVFKEHFDIKTEEYNKIRNLVINSKYFPRFAYKLDEGIVNALLFVPDKKRESIINQAIDTSVTSFLACNKVDKKIALSDKNKIHLVNKIIEEKYAGALRLLEHNNELVDMLIEKGLFKECSNNKHGYCFGTAILALTPNSYLKQKLEEHFLNKVVERMNL